MKKYSLVVAFASFAWAGMAQAATFVVDRTDDIASATACTAAANDCSLRGAIITSNAAGGTNTITLPAGTYLLDLTGACSEDGAASGDLDVINGSVGNNLTINGSLAGPSIIDGNGTDRVFHVPAITTASTLTLNDLTVRNGQANACTPSTGLGGGLRTDQGNITLNHVTVSGNTAENNGGGVHVGGGRLTAVNSTISGNNADGNGGGVFLASFTQADLRNVTITNNHADDAALDAGDGGGVFVAGTGSVDNAILRVRNSIIAGNFDDTTSGNDFPDCSGIGTVTSQGFNLVGIVDGGCSTDFGVGGDQAGTAASPIAPLIGPLANNGGPTSTHLLLTGSTAIDLANSAGCFSNDANTGSLLTSDQRNFTRPLDGNVDGVVRCDIGAVEIGCGNGVVELNEGCDDGNVVDGDGCTAQCVLESCGDGTVQPPEGCDDGNAVNGDGCTAGCVLESCGNGVVNIGEECDDGNAVNTDACTNTCRSAVCGDGFVQTGAEQCDDGNTKDEDSCSSTCTDVIVLLGDGGCSLIRDGMSRARR